MSNIIEILNENDVDKILKLWKTEPEVLGIPFRKSIFELINKQQFFGIKKDGELIAMCGYRVMKRNPSIRITKLCVNNTYRNKGIATDFIRYIQDKTDCLKLKMYAECKDGAENNGFYDKVGILHHKEERKTMTVRFYEIKRL